MIPDNKKIKIAIDGGDFNLNNDVRSGIQRLVYSFCKQLELIRSKDKVFNYYHFAKNIQSNSLTIRVKQLPRKFFSKFWLPICTLKDKNNVFLGFSGVIPPLLSFFPIKKILFLHDLGFLKYPDFYKNAAKMKKETAVSVKISDKIIVFSNYVKNCILKTFPNLPGDKIVCIYPGVNHINNDSINQLIKSKNSAVKYEYFLYVGVIKPIKDIELLFNHFNEFLTQTKNKNIKLMLIGVKEQDYFKYLQKTSIFKKLKKRLIFKNNLTNDQLINYYCLALAVLNVSREEGFCYPVVEALSLGRPVIVNDLNLYQEFKDYFPNLIITKNNKEFVKEMIEVTKKKQRYFIKKNLPFNWQSFTKEVLKVLNEILDKPE